MPVMSLSYIMNGAGGGGVHVAGPFSLSQTGVPLQYFSCYTCLGYHGFLNEDVFLRVSCQLHVTSGRGRYTYSKPKGSC